jgi:hypothetical protein
MHNRLQHWTAIFLLAGVSALAYALPMPEPSSDSADDSPLQVTAGIAGAELNVDGNERRFQQYVSPPEGIYLGLLRLQYLLPTGRMLIDASGQNIGESSANGSAWLVTGGDSAALTGRERNSRFFRDWSSDDEAFKRRDGSYELAVPAGPGEFRVSYDAMSFGQQGADPEEDWDKSIPGIGFTTNINNWQAGMGFDRESFDFDAGTQFSGDTETLRFSFSPPGTGRTSVEASAALLQTSFDALSDAQRGNKFDLRGVHLLNRDLSLIGSLSRDEITETIIQNAYARRDLNGEVRAEYRGLPNTTLEVGGIRRRVDYVVQTQTATFPADQNGYFARGTTRLSRQVKLRLQQTSLWTDDDAIALDQFGNPIGSLVWSTKNDTLAELTYARSWRSGFTGRYRRVRWENDDFTTDNAVTSSSLTGWWLPRDALTLYATYLRQQFNLTGIDPDPGQYTTDDETFVYGASYQASPRLLVDLALTDANARGATGVDQSNLWLSAAYLLKDGARLGLRASIGDFATSDDAPALDYDGTWIELGVSKIVF